MGLWNCELFPFALAKQCQVNSPCKSLVDRRRSQGEPEEPDLFTYLLETENNPMLAGFPLAWEARLAVAVGR